MLLFAAGRVGATDRLNLEAAGITVDPAGRIAVDPLTLQTAAAYLCRRRRDRVAVRWLDLDWSRDAVPPAMHSEWSDGAAGILSLRHHSPTSAGNLDHRIDGRGSAHARNSPEVGVSPIRETSTRPIMG